MCTADENVQRVGVALSTECKAGGLFYGPSLKAGSCSSHTRAHPDPESGRDTFYIPWMTWHQRSSVTVGKVEAGDKQRNCTRAAARAAITWPLRPLLSRPQARERKVTERPRDDAVTNGQVLEVNDT